MSEKYSGRVLIVDDDLDATKFWSLALNAKGFRVDVAHTLGQMRDIVKRYSIDAILLDLQLENENGLDGLPFLLEASPFSKIFILTAHASVDTAVAAMNSGATGYVTKDTDPEEIAKKIHDCVATPAHVASGGLDFASCGLIGRGKAFEGLCQSIQQLKDVDSTILVLGESGTGKEVVARTLHQLSNRSARRFEAINCASIPETLLESELFGHKRGAFTDAKTDRKGIFELCSGGTLLLDEIGDMPLTLQAKLLRVLQERVIIPVGGSTPVKIDTRVVAATHRDLVEEIQNGRFREDLYYRLSVVPLMIPPLRHRKDDIPVLVQKFVKEFTERFNKNLQPPGSDVMRRLLAYDWPGNVRELRNSIERASVLTQDGELRVEHIFQHFDRLSSMSEMNAGADSVGLNDDIFSLELTEAKQLFEKTYTRKLLEVSAGNITDASKRSGRYRADIYRLMEKYDIDHNQYKANHPR